MLNFPIYLDNHSTTKVDPLVVEAMLPYFTEIYGNASSKSHVFGWKAEAAVENARHQAARLINSNYREIIFTSGATESINLAIKGIAETYALKGNHIITCVTEHEAVLDSCRSLEEKGFDVTYLGVDKYGLIDLEEFERSFNERTILVSIMFANNEIGTIQPVNEIAAICKKRNVLFHSDATQAAGKIDIDVTKNNFDLLSFSSHKIYGPKGVGALYGRSKIPKNRITPQIDGGAQERGIRAGTLNVPGIVGFGKACEIAKNVLEAEALNTELLRDRLYEGLISKISGIKLNGHSQKRLPNNLNISIEGVDADSLMMAAKDIAVSTGSACSSESVLRSHVLSAIGVSHELMRSTIRIGIGRFNTSEEIEYVLEILLKKIKELRKIYDQQSGEKDKQGEYAEA
jgi:cysteine desulfurase